MQEIEIKDNEGILTVEFNGSEWRIFNLNDTDGPQVFYHDDVLECPFYLFNSIGDLDDSEFILSELSRKSTSLEKLIKEFQAELSRLTNRLILIERYGSGASDEFVDQIFVTDGKSAGLLLEATIAGDNYGEFAVNAYGEIKVASVSRGIRSGEQFYEAIVTVTNDQYGRWAEIEWSWDELITNSKSQYPSLSDELAIVIRKNERGTA